MSVHSNDLNNLDMDTIQVINELREKGVLSVSAADYYNLQRFNYVKNSDYIGLLALYAVMSGVKKETK